MKPSTIILSLGLAGLVGTAYAQSPSMPGPQAAPSPTVDMISGELADVGARAERDAAAKAIMQLQDQVRSLQKELASRDDVSSSDATPVKPAMPVGPNRPPMIPSSPAPVKTK